MRNILILLVLTIACHKGIHPAPSGQAVYIQDSSCVINMEEDQVGFASSARMMADFLHCMNIHREIHTVAKAK